MQRRIILAATALAAALIVPNLASATDKQAGPGDRAVPEAWQNRDQGGNTSTQNRMAVGGGPNSSTAGQIGGAPSTVGQIGGSTPTGQGVGSTPTGTGTGQAGGPEPTESAIACGPIKKGKAPKDDAAHEKKTPTLPKSDAGDPADDDEATLEAELREQQELMDRLTDLLNQMQQRHNDVTRSVTAP
ncbi:MAG TPA: hypothetical protein VFX80_13340 [Solirubrobacteraceae bacterium]|nr:hypothetical protein [Solirubrobacteraceae bacterium]